MKKPIQLTFFLFIFFNAYSQDTNVLNRDWHIHELFMDGEFIDIPVLAESPPPDCILGLHIEVVEDIYLMHLRICTMFDASLDNFDFNTFTVFSFGGLLGKGPCYEGSTTMGCTGIPGSGQLTDFEYIHHSFFEDYQSTFTYALLPPGTWGYETLHIQKPNGDYALYGEEPLPLSLVTNNLYDFSIYPNPVSDILYLKGTMQNVKDVTVYSLSGQKINTAMTGEKMDVSEMTTGLYFIEIILESGAKQVLKFNKK